MDIIHDGQPVKYKNTVMALGSFDGLHRAHMAIIRECIEYARKNKLKSGIMLFENNIKGGKNITSANEKLRILKHENPDFIYIKKFTADFMKKTPQEFADMLKREFHAAAVCVGYDYRFGYEARGDVNMLCELGEKFGFKVFVMPMISVGNYEVHSTLIRNLIKSGDINTANRLLGRKFSVDGEVVRGLQNGRKMGIPTANVECDNIVLPKDGVYAGITHIDGNAMKSVVNVGNNPTFMAKNTTVESHILDFDEDIYGKCVRVDFVQRLRDDMKFDGMESLKRQINSDIEKTRNIIIPKEE